MLSPDPVAIMVPDGAYASALIHDECPASVRRGCPLAASQIRAVPSSEPVATAPDAVSGENATAVTELPCPVRVRTGTPVATSQMVAVLSVDAIARNAPDGANAIAVR